MADNTSLNAGVGGDVIASDDIAGVKYQIVKIGHGAADAVPVHTSAANPLPIMAVNMTATGTLAAAAQTVALSMAGGLSAAAAQITGTWVGTIQFEGTVDGTTWVPINGVYAGANAPSPTISGNGVVRLTPSGLASFRLHMTAWTSGTATITLRASDGTGGIFANQTLPTKAVENGVVSVVNSSAVNLAAAGVFTGTSEDVAEYSTIMVTVFSSHASATDGLSIQQSMDGTNWDLIDTYSIPAATGKTFSLPVQARFYRVVYTNGATLTTSLRIQTLYSRANKMGSSQRPQDGRSNDNDFEEMLAYGMVYNGTGWDRARGDATNGARMQMPAVIPVTILSAANTAATLTLPAPAAGLFHYITRVRISLHNTSAAAVAGSAVTLAYTSTNIPGALAWTEGNALAAGVSKVVVDEQLENPVKATAAATATTIVAPAAGLGVLTRITAYYFTGP